MFPRLSGMYFSTLFFFGLVGLSVANPIPSGNDGFRYEVGPSQPEPAPENFDIDLTYEEPQRGPYTVDLLPAGRQIGSRFGPAANVAELQNFKYEGVVDPTGFYELYSVVGHLLPDTERTDSGIMFSMCVKYYVSSLPFSSTFHLSFLLFLPLVPLEVRSFYLFESSLSVIVLWKFD